MRDEQYKGCVTKGVKGGEKGGKAKREKEGGMGEWRDRREGRRKKGKG